MVALLKWQLKNPQIDYGMVTEYPYFRCFFLFVQLWIQRINYAAKEHNLSYSSFMYNLVKVQVLCEVHVVLCFYTGPFSHSATKALAVREGS